MTDTTARPIYWELSATDDVDNAISHLREVLAEAEQRLGMVSSQNEETFYCQGSLHVKVEDEVEALNTVNLQSGAGGGMLENPAIEWTNLLVLLYLRANMIPPFWVCDDEGETFAPNSWAETQKVLEDVGVELNEEVLAAALALGLRPAPLEFGESEEIADAWF